MICKKCKGTELIPLVKDGRVISNSWLDCVCREEEPEHYRPYKPEDFDFACSDTFRSYFEEQCPGRPAPSFEYREKLSDRAELVPQYSPREIVNQLRAEVRHIHKDHHQQKAIRIKNTYTIK